MLYILLGLFSFQVLALDMDWQSQGEVTFESRIFKDDDSAVTEDRGLALFSRVQGRASANFLEIVYAGFGRVDRFDSGRDIVAIEDLYLKLEKGAFIFRAGYQVFDWSATEAFHPADVVNSRNTDSDFERQEKLGEPGLNLSLVLGEGDLTAYYWPSFVDPKLPSSRSRLGIGVNLGAPLFKPKGEAARTKPFGTQWGLRLTQVWDDLDLSLHTLHHFDRDRPIVDVNLRPYFFYVNEYGGSLQYVFADSWLLKMEGAWRDYSEVEELMVIRGTGLEMRKNEDHGLLASSLEKGWSFANGSQLTTILEYQTLLGVSNIDKVLQYELNLFQRDLLIGARYAFNDFMGQEIFSSLIMDLERSHEFLWHTQYARRLSDYWKVKLGWRYIDAPLKGAYPVGLEAFHRDHQLFLNLSRYF